MLLPDGYITTSAAGILVLWRTSLEGQRCCVSVFAESTPEDAVLAVALRDAAYAGQNPPVRCHGTLRRPSPCYLPTQ